MMQWRLEALDLALPAGRLSSEVKDPSVVQRKAFREPWGPETGHRARNMGPVTF